MLHPNSTGEKLGAPHRRILRTPEAAAFLGVSHWLLQRWRVTGDGPRFVKIGPKFVGYDLEVLSLWIAERSRTSTSDNGDAANAISSAKASPLHQTKVSARRRSPLPSPADDQAKAAESVPSPRGSRAGKAKSARRRARRLRGEALKATDTDHA